MPNYRRKQARIVWDDAYDKSLYIPYGLDEAITYPLERDGSEHIQSNDRSEDSAILGVDHYLDGSARWIPRDTGTTPEGLAITGWDGATGWCAALQWMRTKKKLRWYPDIVGAAGTYREMYLVGPMTDKPDREPDNTKRVNLSMRTCDGLTIEGY